MGNTESNVASAVKKQAGVSTQSLYKLVDMKGGGLLVDIMKRACQNKQFAEIDHAIKTKVEPMLYNRGAGRYIPIASIVLIRNKERSRQKLLPELRGLENPDDDFNINQHLSDVDEETYALNPAGYRDVCWDLMQRGAVGESILHLCLLHASQLHSDLAKRLLRFYPKLINDVYMSDEYYGENVLHIAIVNEDPTMVKYVLNVGADVNERCYGAFMCPEDQKASRMDSQEHEPVDVSPMTTYDGYVYWGEYPLSFAACLGLDECYRMLLSRGADPDAQDTNGNTVLHMLVIYEKLETFDMAYEMGASLGMWNMLNLTPVTLAAKLGRVEMFFHVMNIEREIYWQLGSVTCAAYPLEQIDTICGRTGNISKDSALNLVVFGDKDEHLELLDGVLIDLLKTKWNTFVKSRFYRQFYLFATYFLVSLVGFLLRPGPDMDGEDDDVEDGGAKAALALSGATEGNGTVFERLAALYPGEQMLVRNLMATVFTEQPFRYNATVIEADDDDDAVEPTETPGGDWWSSYADCPLTNIETTTNKVRVCAELSLLCGAMLYIAAALRESRFLGYNMFVENLMTAPSRVMFLFSCCLMMFVPWLRFFCLTELDDHVSVVIMLTTAPYFLFFCRGFKTVGPFVVMIYRMVMGDLIRFVSIYLVFVMGFAQSYYLIYLSYDNPSTPDGVDDSDANPVPSAMESIVVMFLMSLTNFGDYYGTMDRTNHETEGKILFVVFMVIVAVLLVNMLIAMMGNTYQKIAETRNEWQRQWARIVLVVERGVAPAERLRNFRHYSQPMSDGRRALVLRLNMNDADKDEMKEIMEMKLVHERQRLRRQAERDERERSRQAAKEKVLGGLRQKDRY